MGKVFAPLIAVLALLWSASAFGLEMRCNGSLVQAGDSQSTVLHKCGVPNYRYLNPHYLAPGVNVVIDDQVWYYDRGRNDLIKVLHFNQDVLEKITTAGYGFGPSPPRKCRPNQIRVGMTIYELLQTCGEPDKKIEYTEFRSAEHPFVKNSYRSVRVSLWTYDFGGNWLPRTIRLTNGVVKEVQDSDKP